MKNKLALRVYLILLLSFLVRLYHIQQPLLEGAAGAQLDRATIARNLYLDGEIFSPKGDFLPGPQLRMLEFPLYHLFVTWGYRLAGGVYEWIGRLVSIFSFCVSILFLYLLARDYFNERAGTIAALFYAFSPLTIIYSRSFQSDSLMLSLSIIALYFFRKYLKDRSFFYFFLATVSAAALFLVKIPMLVMGLPLMALVYFRPDSRSLSYWKVLIYGVVSILPSVAWYLYACKSMTDPILNNMITDDWAMASRFDLWRLSDYRFYKVNFENMIGIDLTPIGFTLMVIGFFLKRKSREESFFYCWLGAVVAMFFIMPGHSTEPYYHLPLVPPACVFIGKAVDALLESEKVKDCLWNNYLKRVLLFFLLGVIVVGYANSGYKIPANVVHAKDAGLTLKKISRDSDTVIVWESHQAVLYYSTLKGWLLRRGSEDIESYLKYYEMRTVSPNPIAFIDFLRSLGAQYFITTAPNKLIKQEELYANLKSRFQLIAESDKVLIFKL